MIPTYALRCSAEKFPVVWAHVSALSGGAHCWSALRVPLTLSAPRSAATGEMREMRTKWIIDFSGVPKLRCQLNRWKFWGEKRGHTQVTLCRRGQGWVQMEKSF